MMQKPTDNQQYLLLFAIKFYFWGIAAVSSLFKGGANGFTARGNAVEISLQCTHAGKNVGSGAN